MYQKRGARAQPLRRARQNSGEGRVEGDEEKQMKPTNEEKLVELLTDIREVIVSNAIILHTDLQQAHKNRAYKSLVEMATRIGVIAEQSKN
jgi:hypothetical protein